MNAAAVVLGAVLALQATPAAELKAKFEKRVQEITSRLDGVAGYEFVDLTSGEKIAHLERETFPTASTIQIAIVYEPSSRRRKGGSLDGRCARSGRQLAAPACSSMGTPTRPIATTPF